MHANNPDGIIIPSIFVGGEDGLELRDKYQYDDGYLNTTELFLF
jgi:hypothetical protein